MNKTGKIMRLARRLIAIICFAAVMVLLTAGTSSVALYFHWIERVQIVPVALLTTLLSLILWWLLTYLFGRFYCSTVCPMGVAMDLCSRLPRLSPRSEAKHAYSYSPPLNRLRYSWLLIILLLLIVGLTIVTSIFIPYTAFSRIVRLLFMPLTTIGAMRTVIEGALSGVIIAAATLAIVAFISWRRGRYLCNTFCPVGALLSIPAHASIYAIDINTDRCVGCNLCVEVCKSSCINPSDHTVDSSRCVVCFNCLDICEHQAINYTRHRHRLQLPLMIRTTPPQTSASLEIPDNNE